MQTSQFWPVVWGLGIIGVFCVLFGVLWFWQWRLQNRQDDWGHRDEYNDDRTKGATDDDE
jgi:hypothetical protein